MLMSRNQCHFCSSYPYPQAGKVVAADAVTAPKHITTASMIAPSRAKSLVFFTIFLPLSVKMKKAA
jgi:hypothetical protein